MTHKAEQIMIAIASNLTGLATTGANVERGRRYAWPDGVSAALSINQGADAPIDEPVQTWPILDCELEINIEIHVKSAAADSTLNQIRSEIAVALMADQTQGLAFVIDTVEGAALEPELGDEGEIRSVSQRYQWRVKYQRSRLDPGA